MRAGAPDREQAKVIAFMGNHGTVVNSHTIIRLTFGRTSEGNNSPAPLRRHGIRRGKKIIGLQGPRCVNATESREHARAYAIR